MSAFGNILSKIISVVLVGLLVWFISCKLFPSCIKSWKKFQQSRKEKKLAKAQQVDDVSKNPTKLDKKED